MTLVFGLCQSHVLMVFAHHVLLAENEWAFVYNESISLQQYQQSL